MLALTRKRGQQLMIGDDIVINFVDVQGDSVRIAIDAPKEVKIYRGELYAAIIAENREAAVKKDLDLSGIDIK
jgi:carbon storage regulator